MAYDLKAIAEGLASGKSLRDLATEHEGPNDAPTPQERQQQALRSSLSSGATPPGAEPGIDPRLDGLATFQAAKGAVGSERARALGAQKFIDAANAGDERVVFQHPGEDPRAAWERWRRNVEHDQVALAEKLRSRQSSMGADGHVQGIPGVF